MSSTCRATWLIPTRRGFTTPLCVLRRLGVWDADQAEPISGHDCLNTRVNSQNREQMRYVVADGRLADVKRLGDLAGRLAVREQLEDFELAVSEPEFVEWHGRQDGTRRRDVLELADEVARLTRWRPHERDV